MVVHRLLREGGDNVRSELSGLQRRGGGGKESGGGGLDIFNLANFRDSSSPEGWELSGWLRTYALFLEERFAVLESVGLDTERSESADAPSPTAGWDAAQLLDKLPKLQLLLRRLTNVAPTTSGRLHPVVVAAVSTVFRESTKLYHAIGAGIMNLVDRFFEMPPHQAVAALAIYKSSIRQTDELQGCYSALTALDEFRSESGRYPSLAKPPADFVTTMEQYCGGSPAAGHKAATAPQQRRMEPPHAPPAAAPARPAPPAAPWAAAGAAPDLLGSFSGLSVAAAASAPQADPFAALTPQADPFAAPPRAAPAPAASPMTDLFSLGAAAQPQPGFSAPAHDAFAALPAVEAQPAPQFAPTPAPQPQALDKGLLDSLYAQQPHQGGVGGMGGPFMGSPYGAPMQQQRPMQPMQQLYGAQQPYAAMGPRPGPPGGFGPGTGFGGPPPQQGSAMGSGFGSPVGSFSGMGSAPTIGGYGQAQRPVAPGGFAPPTQQFSSNNPFM